MANVQMSLLGQFQLRNATSFELVQSVLIVTHCELVCSMDHYIFCGLLIEKYDKKCILHSRYS
jgi:hypothetical protein